MKDKGICYVFGAGTHYGAPAVPGPNDLVIAADGGYAYLEKHGRSAHVIVGDCDSLSNPPEGVPLVALPKEKDDTDMAAAVRHGMEAGYRVFHLYGGTGGRLEHTLANIQLLADLAQKGARGCLFDQESVITAICNGNLSFPESAAGYVSVFAHSDAAAGVCEKGLKYALQDATLHNTYPMGVSNEFVGRKSVISVREGTLIIVFPQSVYEIDYFT